jgi:hypothetical protein
VWHFDPIFLLKSGPIRLILARRNSWSVAAEIVAWNSHDHKWSLSQKSPRVRRKGTTKARLLGEFCALRGHTVVQVNLEQRLTKSELLCADARTAP